MTEMQPYLGDVIGELPPMRMPYRRRYEPADWIVNIKHVVVAAVGVTFWAVLFIALLVSMFLAVKPALAQPCTPRNGATPCEEAATKSWIERPQQKRVRSQASVAVAHDTPRILDREFFDRVDSFVDDLMVSMPASVEGAISALEVKLRRLRQKRK